MKPGLGTLLADASSIVPFCGLSLTALALCITSCAPIGTETQRRAAAVPQPDRWKDFVAQAGRGEVEEVSDEVEAKARSPVVNHRIGARAVAQARTKALTDVFSGKFRPEAKTSYATASKEKLVQIESLMKSLPTDAEMSQQHPELVTRGKNQPNHQPRIDLEKRNITVKAWLYWVSRQPDNDYHLILGNTAMLTAGTVFMNAEISGLPPAQPMQEPFVSLRTKLRQLMIANHNRNGAFVAPVPLRISGSLLWDGEHRNPHNVGPKKPTDIRPTKAWEIHPIRDLKS